MSVGIKELFTSKIGIYAGIAKRQNKFSYDFTHTKKQQATTTHLNQMNSKKYNDIYSVRNLC